jgi:hypothetical protein
VTGTVAEQRDGKLLEIRGTLNRKVKKKGIANGLEVKAQRQYALRLQFESHKNTSRELAT